MPHVHRFSIIRTGLAQRFASRSSLTVVRLVIVLFSVIAGGFDARSVFADVMWGSMSFFGSVPESPVQQVAPAPDEEGTWHHSRHHTARRHLAARVRTTRAHHERDAPGVARRHSGTAEASNQGGSSQSGGKSMCVRLCDGFAFPVGYYSGSQDRASHEATCQSECPSAATALYVEPSSSDSIGDATRVGTGERYSSLPYAFRYTTLLSDACTCHPPSGSRVKSLLHDFTLRRGDAVMTAAGIRVFHGGAHYPYLRTDFASLARTRDLRKGERANFHALERASMRRSTDVAEEIRASPAPAAESSKTVEKQASLAEIPIPPARP